MSDPEKPKARFRRVPSLVPQTGKVIPMKRVFPMDDQPDFLSAADALRVVRMIANDSSRIFVVAHAKARSRQRSITRPQIERCVQKGTITEGPFVNAHGNWQANLTRYAAGEEITCVVAIEWVTKVVVITAF